MILENIKPVGYHLWIDDHTLALFVLGGSGKPNYLEIFDMRTQKSEFVTENPGRVLRKVPNQNKFSFVHKIADGNWEIKAYDLHTHTSASLIATIPGVVPGLHDRPRGCLFNPRCAYANARCRAVQPELRPWLGGKVRCHYPLAAPDRDADIAIGASESNLVS